MSIVSTVIVSDGGTPRQVIYLCTDYLGGTHKYGPVMAGSSFDTEAHKTVVAAKVAAGLAEREATQLLGSD